MVLICFWIEGVIVIRVFFLFFLFLIDIYASSVPKLLDNNRSIDPLDKNRISNQDTFISPTIQRADVSRNKLLLQGDNLYIGWDLIEGKEIWRNIGSKTQCSDCLPYPELLMFQNEDRALIRPSYAGGSGVFFGVLMNAILEIGTDTGLFKVFNLKSSGILRKSHDDSKLLIDNEDGAIKVFDLQTLQLIAEYAGGKGRWHWGWRYQPQVFMTPDGKKIFQMGDTSIDSSIPVNYINCDDDKMVAIDAETIFSNSFSTKLRAVNNNGKIVFLEGIVNREKKVIAYDVDDGRLLYDLNLSFSKIKNLFISQNDEHLYILDDDSHLKIISVKDGRILITIKMNSVKTIQPIEHTRYLTSLEHGILQILDANFNQLVTLQSMVDNEWIIITEGGYFNASSKLALSDVQITEQSNKRLLKDTEIKKYFRPDIVSAILQQKPIHDLETKQIEFTLPEKAVYVNQYYPSLRAMYVKEKNPYGLAILAQEKNPDDLKLIKQAILDLNNSDIKSTLYRSLNNFDENETLPFVYEQLDKQTSIDDQIILLSLIKNIDIRVQKLLELVSKKLLSENTIIWFATWARVEDCQTFEPLLWQAVEKSLKIRNEVVLNYLIKKNPKRLEKIWMKSAIKVLKANTWSDILDLSRILPYLHRLNPTQTIKLLTDPQYPFNVNLYETVRDPALTEVLIKHLIKDEKLDSKVFTILISYQNPEINKQMIEIIQHMDCKKIYKSLKEKIESSLNITLPCDKN